MLKLKGIDLIEGESSKDSLRLLSVNEARKILRVRYMTVRKLIDNGMIGTMRLNGRTKIPLVSLRKFVSDQTNLNIQTNKKQTHEDVVNQIISKYKQK